MLPRLLSVVSCQQTVLVREWEGKKESGCIYITIFDIILNCNIEIIWVFTWVKYSHFTLTHFLLYPHGRMVSHVKVPWAPCALLDVMESVNNGSFFLSTSRHYPQPLPPWNKKKKKERAPKKNCDQDPNVYAVQPNSLPLPKGLCPILHLNIIAMDSIHSIFTVGLAHVLMCHNL